MKKNIFLFIIWSKARKFEREIREELEHDFKILKETEIRWRWWGFPNRLHEFYKFGTKFIWWNKARKCGRGPFKVIVIEDENPIWIERMDTRGQKLIVNDRVYAAKKGFRKLTKHSNIVHSSVTHEETDEQMEYLFGKTWREEFR